MKSLLRLAASAVLSLMLVSSLSVSITGCSADTLSGPNFEANGTNQGGGTAGGGSDHNTDKTEVFGGGTSGGGSDHNIDDTAE